jgi:ubiquinone/menaquinone biosynthesis C-methylase UbiE
MIEVPVSLLSERQQRELRYHRAHARRLEEWARSAVEVDILDPHRRRWWNAYWHAYTLVLSAARSGSRALVVGCGFGDDAVRLARLGFRVSAFDLSPESLEIAAARAAGAGVSGAIDFRCRPCERLDYDPGTFDLTLAVDILHHVDIAGAMRELRRVATPGGLLVCNEPYTHSALTKVRESRLVCSHVYPRVIRWMHGVRDASELYVTEDERKLDQRDLADLQTALPGARVDYFNMVTGRLVPERFVFATRVDRVGLRALGPLAGALGGRIVVSGRFPATTRIAGPAVPAKAPGAADATSRAA